MGLIIRNVHGKDFLVYLLEKEQLYIGPKGEYDKGKIDVVRRATLHNDQKIDDVLKKYIEDMKELSNYYPEPERKEYLSKRTAELWAFLRRLEPEIQKISIIPTDKERTVDWKKAVNDQYLNKKYPNEIKHMRQFLRPMMLSPESLKIVWSVVSKEEDYFSEKGYFIAQKVTSFPKDRRQKYLSEKERRRLQEIKKILKEHFEKVYPKGKSEQELAEDIDNAVETFFPFVEHISNPTKMNVIKTLAKVVRVERDVLNKLPMEKYNVWKHRKPRINSKGPTDEKLNELVKKKVKK